MSAVDADPVRPYAGLAQVWASDAELAYGPLARHLVDRTGVDLRGSLALDAGAGSGAAGNVLRGSGARVIAVDVEVDMARHVLSSGTALAADVTALPFRSACFDLTVAAFLINHLERPVAGLSELWRVTRPGGVLLASVFSNARSPAKTAVDEVAAAYGHVALGWYLRLQHHAAAVGTVGSMTRVLQAAGVARFEVSDVAVDLGLDPVRFVRYRTGTANLRPFLGGLTPRRRDSFLAEASTAVERTGGAFAPRVIEVVARR